MLVWTCLETQKEKKRKNVTMKYLSLSWQASICLAYLPTSSFILSFFILFSLFPLFFVSFSFSFFVFFVDKISFVYDLDRDAYINLINE